MLEYTTRGEFMQDKYYEKIKEKIIDTEVTVRVKEYSKNKVIIENYYEIGRLIVEAQGGEEKAKYGNSLIREYAKKLTTDLGKGYTYTSLSRMRQFYILFQKVAPVAQDLSWSNWVELLPLKNIDEIKYYIGVCYENRLSKRQLREKIKSHEYEKLSDNVKKKFLSNEKVELTELVKDPIVIANPNNIEVAIEKTLQKLIMENIYSFLKQLGNNYMFVGNEYPIKIGDRTYRIDLLLYNIEYDAYVVVELKIGELKKEHLGQVELYMNYVDKHIRKKNQNSTIGIILCHKNNKLLMKYCSDFRIIARSYVFN